MSKNGGDFKTRCISCGCVKTDNDEWIGSVFIKEEMLEGLPEEPYPWCLTIKQTYFSMEVKICFLE